LDHGFHGPQKLAERRHNKNLTIIAWLKRETESETRLSSLSENLRIEGPGERIREGSKGTWSKQGASTSRAEAEKHFLHRRGKALRVATFQRQN